MQLCCMPWPPVSATSSFTASHASHMLQECVSCSCTQGPCHSSTKMQDRHEPTDMKHVKVSSERCVLNHNKQVTRKQTRPSCIHTQRLYGHSMAAESQASTETQQHCCRRLTGCNTQQGGLHQHPATPEQSHLCTQECTKHLCAATYKGTNLHEHIHCRTPITVQPFFESHTSMACIYYSHSNCQDNGTHSPHGRQHQGIDLQQCCRQGTSKGSQRAAKSKLHRGERAPGALHNWTPRPELCQQSTCCCTSSRTRPQPP